MYLRRMSTARSVIISDLHVGAGPLDDCDEELERNLTAFLGELSTSDGPVELVIDGDFLDFVQAPPWQGKELEAVAEDGTPLCFTEAQSVAKLGAVVADHRPIFDALGGFLASGADRTLTILPGNHDADLFWPEVRAAFADAVFRHGGAGRDRLGFVLEQVYRPKHAPRAWIEHGHQHDPLNAFARGGHPCWSEATPPIHVDRSGARRLVECIGTRFMIRFMNRLDRDYPFVDNVKPFSRFVALFGASALVPGFGPLRAAVGIWTLLRYLGRETVTAPADLLGLSGGEGGDRSAPGAFLAARLGEVDDAAREAFADALRGRGFRVDRPLSMLLGEPDRAEALLDFLGEHADLLDALEADGGADLLGLDGTGDELALGKGFFVDETAELRKAARAVRRDPDVGAVVMGHTHEPVDDPALGYLNTGSWTRYYRFEPHEAPRPWSMLRRREFDAFPYELRYAELSADGARSVLFRQRAKGG